MKMKLLYKNYNTQKKIIVFLINTNLLIKKLLNKNCSYNYLKKLLFNIIISNCII